VYCVRCDFAVTSREVLSLAEAWGLEADIEDTCTIRTDVFVVPFHSIPVTDAQTPKCSMASRFTVSESC
jgi:hypothetical protein